MELDIEAADENFFQETSSCDCWIFGDPLEHLRDPWLVLSKVRKAIPGTGCVVASGGNYAEAWYEYARKFMQKHFPSSGEPARANLFAPCTLGMNSADEWRSFTQYMIFHSA